MDDRHRQPGTGSRIAVARPDRARPEADERQVPLPQDDQGLKRLRDDYLRAGEEPGFAACLDDLRQRQRRKTSFIAKLDSAFTISGVPV